LISCCPFQLEIYPSFNKIHYKYFLLIYSKMTSLPSDAPIFPFLGSALNNTPILMVSDVTSGLTRAVYEKYVNKSTTGRAVTEFSAQTIGSGIGRLLDSSYGDDMLYGPVGTVLAGSNPIAKSLYTGIATGIMDYGMGRNNSYMGRWATPVVTDGISTYATMYATGGQDKRVL
jgi:hypothetical protein